MDERQEREPVAIRNPDPARGHERGTVAGGLDNRNPARNPRAVSAAVGADPGSARAQYAMGLLLVESIFSRDYAVVQGIVLVFSSLFILTNLVVDLFYAVIDPRIRYDR